MHPHDPHQPWQQGYQQPQQPSHYPPPPQPVPYQQQPRRRVVKSVEKQRGLGGMANTTHFMLTLFTCGLWLMVWIPWWIIRVIIPRRKVTKHYYR